MGTPRLKVRNLKRYQHYKNRRPPWVKLYNTITEDYEFVSLPDASKWLAVGLLLLASRYDNHVPADPDWIGKQLGCTEPVDLEPVLSAAVVEICQCRQCASTARAAGKQDAPLEVEVEREIQNASRSGATAPDASTLEGPKKLTPQQARVQRVRDLWADIPPEVKHPDGGLVATWLKGWNDDDALVRVLVDLKAQGKFGMGAGYVTSCLATAFQNGKRVPDGRRPADEELVAQLRAPGVRAEPAPEHPVREALKRWVRVLLDAGETVPRDVESLWLNREHLSVEEIRERFKALTGEALP